MPEQRIQVGSRLPDATVRKVTADGPKEISIADFCRGRKVVLFAVVGAYTGTCNKQLPSFVEHADAIRAKGVAEIACLAVNDPFVLAVWAKEVGSDKVTMLSDGNGEFTAKIGMTLDGSKAGLGNRTHRYSMIVDDGLVKTLDVEPNPGVCEISSGGAILDAL